VAGALAFLATAPAARAAERFQLTVVAILGNDRDDKVDPKLKCIAEEVKKNRPNLNLTGFRIHSTAKRALGVGSTFTFPLVDDEKAPITIDHGLDDQAMVGLKVKAPGGREIDYSTVCGKFFPIVTCYETKDRERLILAIMVEPCKK
jgi:hypothetical protein